MEIRALTHHLSSVGGRKQKGLAAFHLNMAAWPRLGEMGQSREKVDTGSSSGNITYLWGVSSIHQCVVMLIQYFRPTAQMSSPSPRHRNHTTQTRNHKQVPYPTRNTTVRLSLATKKPKTNSDAGFALLSFSSTERYYY